MPASLQPLDQLTEPWQDGVQVGHRPVADGDGDELQPGAPSSSAFTRQAHLVQLGIGSAQTSTSTPARRRARSSSSSQSSPRAWPWC
jgi:hypothetical protein